MGLRGPVFLFHSGIQLSKRMIPFGNNGTKEGVYLMHVSERDPLPRDDFKTPTCKLAQNKLSNNPNDENYVKNGSNHLIVKVRDEVCKTNAEATLNYGKWYWCQFTNWISLSNQEQNACKKHYFIDPLVDIPETRPKEE